MEPGSLALQTDSLPTEPSGKPSTRGKVWDIRPELCEQGCGVLETRSGTSGWDCEVKGEEDCGSRELNQFTYRATYTKRNGDARQCGVDQRNGTV